MSFFNILITQSLKKIKNLFIDSSYYSRKYILISIVFTWLIYLTLYICLKVLYLENYFRAGNNSSSQTIHIKLNLITNKSVSNLNGNLKDSTPNEINKDYGESSLIHNEKYYSNKDEIEYDTPAVLITTLDSQIIEIDNLIIDHEKPLVTIKIFIEKTGRVSETEIINTQLDDITTKNLAANLARQVFIPAGKNGKGVKSTITYIAYTDKIIIN